MILDEFTLRIRQHIPWTQENASPRPSCIYDHLLAPREPVLSTTLGGTPVSLGTLIALVAAAGLVVLGRQEPRLLLPEAQLLLTRPPRRPEKRREQVDGIT
ncbi:MAG: hypothetical protein F7C08_04090 [Desulfurococcales archaeon]|nr:hypothetical protein [Desulfurococcales archaeon]MCE4605694.1 hypothetical protein [Desulfurococcales archaeon]